MPIEQISSNNLSFGKRKTKPVHITYKSPIKTRNNKRKAKLAMGLSIALAGAIGTCGLIKKGKAGENSQKLLNVLKNISAALLGFLAGISSYFKKENHKEEYKPSNETISVNEISEKEIELFDDDENDTPETTQEKPIEVIDEEDEQEEFYFEKPIEVIDEEDEQEEFFFEEPIEVIDKKEQIDNINATNDMLNDLTGKKIYKSQPVEFEEGFFEEIKEDKTSKAKSIKFDDDFVKELMGDKEPKAERVVFDDDFVKELMGEKKPAKKDCSVEEINKFIVESLADIPPEQTHGTAESGKKAKKNYIDFVSKLKARL